MAKMVVFIVILYVFVEPLSLSKISSPNVLFPSSVFSKYDDTIQRVMTLNSACFTYLSAHQRFLMVHPSYVLTVRQRD